MILEMPPWEEEDGQADGRGSGWILWEQISGRRDSSGRPDS